MVGKIFKKNVEHKIEVIVLSADEDGVTIQNTASKGATGKLTREVFEANYVEIVEGDDDLEGDMAVSNDEINTKEVKNSKGKI